MALNRFKYGVGFVLDATDRATQTFRKIGTGFRTMTQGIVRQARQMRLSMAAVAIGAPLMLAGTQALRGLGALSDAAGKFEQGIAAVGAVTKATTAELRRLEDAAVQAGIKTQFSPREAVEGLHALSTAGQTARQAVETLVPVLDLAAGSMGQLGVAEAAEAVVGTLNAYGMAAERSAGVTDKLLRITQLTNFQTRDFQIGLSKAAATGATFEQSLNDVLITMGLLRNRNIDASSSATAVRESVRRLGADQGAQQKLMQRGIRLYDDQTGKMRSIIDITLDLAEASKSWTDEERNRMVAQVYGARGLLAFNAISKATFTTMKDGVEVTDKGREAIAGMRREMDRTAGTAEEFRRKLLDTFEGQKTLLRGTLETMAVVFGKPFTKMLAPIVDVFVRTLNAMIRIWQKIPAPVQKAIMAFVTVAAIVTALVGGVLLLKGMLGLLGLSFGGIVTTIAQVLVALPLVGVLLGGISVAVYAAYRAFKKNTGGIATSWKDLTRQLRLGFEGVIAIIKGEKFSDALREELDRAENQGVLRFLDRVMLFKERLVAFWEGLKAGFERGVGALAESSAMKRLMATFNSVFGIFTGAEGRNTEDVLRRWGHSGEEAGMRLAKLGEIALQALNTIVDLGKTFAEAMSAITAEDIKAGITGLVDVFKGFHSVVVGIGKALSVIKSVFMVIYRVIRVVGAALGEMTAAIVSNLDFIRGAREKRMLPFYEHFKATAEEARGLAGEFGATPLGLGETPEAAAKRITADTRAIEAARLRMARTGATRLLERRKREGGDVAQMVGVLKLIETRLDQLKKLDVNVTVDADQLNARLREADERDIARGTEEMPVAAAF